MSGSLPRMKRKMAVGFRGRPLMRCESDAGVASLRDAANDFVLNGRGLQVGENDSFAMLRSLPTGRSNQGTGTGRLPTGRSNQELGVRTFPSALTDSVVRLPTLPALWKDWFSSTRRLESSPNEHALMTRTFRSALRDSSLTPRGLLPITPTLIVISQSVPCRSRQAQGAATFLSPSSPCCAAA